MWWGQTLKPWKWDPTVWSPMSVPIPLTWTAEKNQPYFLSWDEGDVVWNSKKGSLPGSLKPRSLKAIVPIVCQHPGCPGGTTTASVGAPIPLGDIAGTIVGHHYGPVGHENKILTFDPNLSGRMLQLEG